MNRKNRLAWQRRTKSRVKKWEIEVGVYPGTEFDKMIQEMLFALRSCGTNPCHAVTATAGMSEQRAWGEYMLAQHGYTIADAIRRGDSKMFRDLADAIDAWRVHQPNAAPDRLHLLLIQFCDPDHAPFQMRDILAYLKKHLRNNPYDDDRILERTIRRKCRQLGFQIKGKPGRPKGNPDTK